MTSKEQKEYVDKQQHFSQANAEKSRSERKKPEGERSVEVHGHKEKHQGIVVRRKEMWC